MNKVIYKCDCCSKKFNVESKGKILYPENSIVVDGEGFVFCSSKCMNKADKRIVTAREVETILKSLNGFRVLA